MNKHPAQYDCEALLEQWLRAATRGLCKRARERITVEIEAHVATAYDEALNKGADTQAATFQAVQGLGSPRAARRRFRKCHLTQWEALRVAYVDRRFDKPKQWALLLGFYCLFLVPVWLVLWPETRLFRRGALEAIDIFVMPSAATGLFFASPILLFGFDFFYLRRLPRLPSVTGHLCLSVFFLCLLVIPSMRPVDAVTFVGDLLFSIIILWVGTWTDVKLLRKILNTGEPLLAEAVPIERVR